VKRITGEKTNAKNDSRATEELNRKLSDAYILLGKLAVDAPVRRDSKIRERFEKAKEAYPSNLLVLYHLGMYYSYSRDLATLKKAHGNLDQYFKRGGGKIPGMVAENRAARAVLEQLEQEIPKRK